MKIFFAGVPGGNQAERERGLVKIGMKRRLITFFYERQAEITLMNFGKGENKMEMFPVESSNIQAIGHEGTTLRIEFINGSVYDYESVPHQVYEEMLDAPSAGKFLHQRIKGIYSYKKRSWEAEENA